MECLTCKRMSENTFNIHTEYGDTEHTIKDDFEEISAKVLPHLQPEDRCCDSCTKMLDDIAKIKRQLEDIIIHQREKTSPVNYGSYWQFLDRNSQHSFTQRFFNDTPRPTPDSAVNYNAINCKENDDEFEVNLDNRERPLSVLSTGSSVRSVSTMTDEEVEKFFTTKKKRGRPKSVEIGRKKSRAHLRSVQSENDLSFWSSDGTPRKQFDDDDGIRNVATRSLSRLSRFYCSLCHLYENNLTSYTSHMVAYHAYKTFYTCSQCDTNYLKEEHLRMHEKIHDTYFVMCTICGNGLESLSEFREHVRKHIIFSVPCSYCDLAFLTKKEFEKHVSKMHKGKKRKIEYPKTHKILEKIVYYEQPDSNDSQTNEYEGRIYLLDVQERRTFQEQQCDDLVFRPANFSDFTVPHATGLGDDLVDNFNNRLLGSQNGFLSSDTSSNTDESLDSEIAFSKRVKRSSRSKSLSISEIIGVKENTLVSYSNSHREWKSEIEKQTSNDFHGERLLENQSPNVTNSSYNSQESENVQLEMPTFDEKVIEISTEELESNNSSASLDSVR